MLKSFVVLLVICVGCSTMGTTTQVVGGPPVQAVRDYKYRFDICPGDGGMIIHFTDMEDKKIGSYCSGSSYIHVVSIKSMDVTISFCTLESTGIVALDTYVVSQSIFRRLNTRYHTNLDPTYESDVAPEPVAPKIEPKEKENENPPQANGKIARL